MSDNNARWATFEDFQTNTYTFELVSPDDERLLVELRALTPAELLEVGKANPRPEPPVKDFQKIEGTVYPVYRTEDPAHQQSLEEWVMRRARLQVVRALVRPEIPGNTDTARIENLLGVPNWVQTGLWLAVQKLNASQEKNLILRPFHSDGNAADEDVEIAGVE